MNNLCNRQEVGSESPDGGETNLDLLLRNSLINHFQLFVDSSSDFKDKMH